ncbi:MAG: phosphoglycerate kinase [Clostridia bacterium]|nr:phosphoglycerate kinase [Clostridia bacterium]MDD4571076.1 phosphoglycerate kinase [Clostridia bacterium]
MGFAIYEKKTVRDIDVNGKKVLVRVDFNVPLTSDCRIADDTRISAAVPTVKYLRDRGAILILISHLGRPNGEVDPRFSLRPCANRFAQILGSDVGFCTECIGDVPKKMIKKMHPGDVLVLENLRFHIEEEQNDPKFAAQLAELADIYVDDAFGAAHRYHASMEAVPKLIPAVSGLLVEKELVIMGKALSNPDRPFVAIMGGAKVTDKIGVVHNLLEIVDTLMIGGGIGHTFLAAQGYDMGKSRVNSANIEWAKELLKKPNAKKLMLPVDLVVAEAFDENSPTRIVDIDQVPTGWMALDIGPRTIEKYKKIISEAKTIVWNGPMGVFEMEPFANGTREIAIAVAKSNGVSIIGGGDSVAAVEKMGVSYRVNHISTGGGSTLEFLEGKDLPAIKVLNDLD